MNGFCLLFTFLTRTLRFENAYHFKINTIYEIQSLNCLFSFLKQNFMNLRPDNSYFSFFLNIELIYKPAFRHFTLFNFVILRIIAHNVKCPCFFFRELLYLHSGIRPVDYGEPPPIVQEWF